MYEEGQGVDKDPAKAASLYLEVEAIADSITPLENGRRPTVMSANVGNHSQAIGSAMLALGVCYAQGLGLEKDMEKAAAAYRKGANNRNATAQYNLGVMTLYGEGGLQQDTARAKVLFSLAIENGDLQLAKDALKALETA